MSRKRLFETIERLKTPGVVLISGDVHYAEIFKADGDLIGTGYPIYEITSSGMATLGVLRCLLACATLSGTASCKAPITSTTPSMSGLILEPSKWHGMLTLSLFLTKCNQNGN